MGNLVLSCRHQDKIFAKGSPFEQGPQTSPILTASAHLPQLDKASFLGSVARLRLRFNKSSFEIDEKQSSELKVLERRKDSNRPYSINLIAHGTAIIKGTWHYDNKTADVTIQLVEIHEDKLKLAIEAPTNIHILRGSILPLR